MASKAMLKQNFFTSQVSFTLQKTVSSPGYSNNCMKHTDYIASS